jgi:AraC-like DNA-binding protein
MQMKTEADPHANLNSWVDRPPLGRPVSLADLCLAAGVSARALQYAFRDLYGVSPIRYFRLRRLHEAHRSLRSALPERSAVKRAALGAGLTATARAVEKEPLDKESRGWKRVELQPGLGDGCHCHPHQNEESPKF